MKFRSYLHHVPAWMMRFMPASLVWRIPAGARDIYLTFDDGPHPEITPWVLGQLAEASFPATFFMIGHRVHAFPEVALRVWDQGHGIGNHTYTHLRGTATPTATYLAEIEATQQAFTQNLGLAPAWFRPPYGSITRQQIREISPNFQIAMMDIIPGDFDASMPGEACLEVIKRHARPGSVVVLHDSEKAFPRLKIILPALLGWLKAQGYTGKLLPGSRPVGHR